MSTTTQHSPLEQEHTKPGDSIQQSVRGWLLILLVFSAGAVSLAVEMAASRLFAPYFGTSLFVWANLIGLILLYLTVGYYIGGRLADKHPAPRMLYGISVLAALLIGIIPAIAPAVLHWTLLTFINLAPTEFYGSLIAALILFALPTFLLGCVSPYAIRLRIEQIGRTGRTVGLLYAISTAGSLVGTFLAVLVTLQMLGTALTFILFAAALLLVSLPGLLLTWKRPIQPEKE